MTGRTPDDLIVLAGASSLRLCIRRDERRARQRSGTVRSPDHTPPELKNFTSAAPCTPACEASGIVVASLLITGIVVANTATQGLVW
jgi:hypothetical protein